MELLTNLNSYIKKVNSPDIKTLHEKCDKLMEVMDKLNDRLARVEQYKSDTPMTKDGSPLRIVTPGTWIKRIEPELDEEFKVQDITPKECTKVIVPKNTEQLCIFFEPVNIKEDTYVVFKKTNEKCTLDVSKLTTDHYIWAVNGDKVEGMAFKEVAELITKSTKNGCSLYFKKFSSAQKRAREASDDMKLEGLREKLWKQYLIFFSSKYREGLSSKNHRYRPGCGSCSNKRAVEKLRDIIEKRREDICKFIGREYETDKLFENVDKLSDTKYKELMTNVEEPPKKKQKTVRQLYLQRGLPEQMYDVIAATMSEDQIREAYNL